MSAKAFLHPVMLRTERSFKRLMKDFSGGVGYGVAIMLIEILSSEADQQIPVSDVDLLADEIGISIPILNTIVTKYNIFEIQDDNIVCPMLSEWLEPYMIKIEQNRRAGKISAEKRKEKAKQQELLLNLSQTGSTEHVLNTCSTNKTKENKRKENKETQQQENGSSDNINLEKWISEKSKNKINPAAYASSIKRRFFKKEQSILDEFKIWEKLKEEFKYKETEEEKKNKIEHTDYSFFIKNPQFLMEYLKAEKSIEFVVDAGLSTLDITFEDSQTTHIFKKDLYPFLKNLEQEK